jgi:zinc transporter ZupT
MGESFIYVWIFHKFKKKNPIILMSFNPIATRIGFLISTFLIPRISSEYGIIKAFIPGNTLCIISTIIVTLAYLKDEQDKKIDNYMKE